MPRPLPVPAPDCYIVGTMRRTIPALLALAVLCSGILSPRIAAQKVKTKPSKSSPTASDVDPKTTAARREYRARARRLANSDVVGHFVLAQWCGKKKLPRCARWELHVVLREAPDHVGARTLLGQAYHEGKWLHKSTAMKAKGLVNVDGKWMRKYDAVRTRARQKHRLSVQHRANLLFARLADRNPSIRAVARRNLEALAKAEKMPELLKLANRKAREYGDFWRARGGSYTAYTGLITVNATLSTLESMQTFTTSLGTGSPVRLQLPRMKTISIGTTVSVPLGFGR